MMPKISMMIIPIPIKPANCTWNNLNNTKISWLLFVLFKGLNCLKLTVEKLICISFFVLIWNALLYVLFWGRGVFQSSLHRFPDRRCWGRQWRSPSSSPGLGPQMQTSAQNNANWISAELQMVKLVKMLPLLYISTGVIKSHENSIIHNSVPPSNILFSCHCTVLWHQIKCQFANVITWQKWLIWANTLWGNIQISHFSPSLPCSC